MNIRPMAITDIEKVRRMGQLMQESNLTANDAFWTKDELDRWISGNADTLLVAEEEGEIIGFLLSTFHSPTKRAELQDLFIAPDWRRKGVGSELMKSFIDAVKQKGAADLYFVVRRGDEGAIRFYRKFFIEGFEFVAFGTEFPRI